MTLTVYVRGIVAFEAELYQPLVEGVRRSVDHVRANVGKILPANLSTRLAVADADGPMARAFAGIAATPTTVANLSTASGGGVRLSATFLPGPCAD